MALKPIEEHVFGVKLFFKDYTNVIFFDKLIYCSKSMYILTFMTMINQVYIRVLMQKISHVYQFCANSIP